MEYENLIDELYYCASQCARCYHGCQKEDMKDMLERCMMLDQDCEELCRLTAQVLERGSENGPAFAALCAEICDACAEECERHADMEHCKSCAEACRKCAQMCRDQAGKKNHDPQHKGK